MGGVVEDGAGRCAEGNPVSPPGVVAECRDNTVRTRARECGDFGLVFRSCRHCTERAWESVNGRCCDGGCLRRMAVHVNEVCKDIRRWQHIRCYRFSNLSYGRDVDKVTNRRTDTDTTSVAISPYRISQLTSVRCALVDTRHG